MTLEQELEGAEAAEDVLRGISAIDPHDEAFWPLAPKRGSAVENRVVRRQRVQLPGSMEIGRATVFVSSSL